MTAGTGMSQRATGPGTVSSALLRDHPEHFGAGPAATGVRAAGVMAVDTQRQPKRTEFSHVTGPQRVNEHQNTLGDTWLRSHAPTDRMMGHGQELVARAGGQGLGVGEVRQNLNKLPSVNPLLADLGLGTRQLASNPLALSVV